MKFYGELGRGLKTNWLYFGDDPHHYPDPGVRSGSRCGSGNLHCKNHSAMLAFGGGLCSLSTSGCSVCLYLSLTVNNDVSSSACFAIGRVITQ